MRRHKEKQYQQWTLWISKSVVGPSTQTHSTPWSSFISGIVHLLNLHLLCYPKTFVPADFEAPNGMTFLTGWPTAKTYEQGWTQAVLHWPAFSLPLHMINQNFPEGTMPGPRQLLLNLSYLGCRQSETCFYWVISSFFENKQKKPKPPKVQLKKQIKWC